MPRSQTEQPKHSTKGTPILTNKMEARFDRAIGDDTIAQELASKTICE